MSERKSINAFANEVGANPMAVRSVLRRMKAWLEETPGRKVEIQGLGVFRLRNQEISFKKNQSTWYQIPARTVVAMSPPRRRRDIKFTTQPTDFVRFLLKGLPDNAGSEVLTLFNGLTSTFQPARTPVLNELRNYVMTPVPNQPRSAKLTFSYEKLVLQQGGGFDWEIRRDDVFIFRDGVQFRIEGENNGDGAILSGLQMWDCGYRSAWGHSLDRIRNASNEDPQTWKRTHALAQSFMMHARGEVVAS